MVRTIDLKGHVVVIPTCIGQWEKFEPVIRVPWFSANLCGARFETIGTTGSDGQIFSVNPS